MATEPTVRVAVAFHSDSGHIANPAHSVASSVVEVHGAVATVLALHDQDFDDEWWGTLDRTDAIVFGAFTYIGGPSAVFKRFAEATLPIWVRQGCRSKVAAGFTHSQAMSGEKLNLLQYFSILAVRHGMIWVNLGVHSNWKLRPRRQWRPSMPHTFAVARHLYGILRDRDDRQRWPL